MKLHFDSKHEFQLEAIKAITDIFEGQPLDSGDFEFSIGQPGILLTENGFGNKSDVKRFIIKTVPGTISGTVTGGRTAP